MLFDEFRNQKAGRNFGRSRAVDTPHEIIKLLLHFPTLRILITRRDLREMIHAFPVSIFG
jgi:hypothetical protein